MSSLTSIANKIRISGLSSGLDTDSMITSLMSLEKAKVDKLYKAKTLIEWKNEALRNINNTIRDFRNKYLSALSPATNIFTESAFKVNKVEIDQNNAVTVTAGTTAKTGNYQIVSIEKLAKPAMILSDDNAIKGEIKLSDNLKDLPLHKPLFEEGETEITFTINGAEITLNDTDTLETMMSKINNSQAGVTFSYSSLSGKFSLVTKETGESAEIVISGDNGKIFGENSVFGFTSFTAGENARLTINDGTGSYTIERNSNIFTIDGITYNLRATSDTPINFSITQDLDTPLKKITDFINSYNVLVKELTDKIYEKKNYSYSPLTDEQKKEMKDEEIEKWESMAKSGLLRNDSKIQSLLAKMRSVIYEKLDGVGLSLADIGITTGSYETRGQLVIDEEKFKKALSERPDDVVKLFTNVSSATDADEKYKQTGVAPKLMSLFSDYVGSIDFTKLEEDIRNYESLIKEQEYKLYQKQEAYYRKFAALESALAEMYSQSSWLTQQFMY